MLARRRVEPGTCNVLLERVELGKECRELSGADRADRAAPPVGEVARATEELVPRAARGLRIGQEIVEIPADAGRAEGGTYGHARERTGRQGAAILVAMPSRWIVWIGALAVGIGAG